MLSLVGHRGFLQAPGSLRSNTTAPGSPPARLCRPGATAGWTDGQLMHFPLGPTAACLHTVLGPPPPLDRAWGHGSNRTVATGPPPLLRPPQTTSATGTCQASPPGLLMASGPAHGVTCCPSPLRTRATSSSPFRPHSTLWGDDGWKGRTPTRHTRDRAAGEPNALSSHPLLNTRALAPWRPSPRGSVRAGRAGFPQPCCSSAQRLWQAALQ